MAKTAKPQQVLVRWFDSEDGRWVPAQDVLMAGLAYIDLRPANEAVIIAGLLSWLAPILGK